MTAPRGLDGVVAVQTRLSHVDGGKGSLIIGGYELEALAGTVTFEEAAHLLWTGSLPTRPQAEALSGRMARLRRIPKRTMVRERQNAGGAPSHDCRGLRSGGRRA